MEAAAVVSTSAPPLLRFASSAVLFGLLSVAIYTEGMRTPRHRFVAAVLVCVGLSLGGCASLIGKVTSGLAADLSDAILNSDDPAVIRDGAPAYLIMLDAFTSQGAGSADMLRAAASLNSAYATAFVSDPTRRGAFAQKALGLALRAACLDARWLCAARTMPFEELEQQAAAMTAADVPAAYALATAWAGWIQAHADDWNAVADLGRVRPLMARVLELDERYDNGGPRLYMGVFETLLPEALGGKPELGRAHFERAIEITGGKHLLVKVFYAESYARLVFDRELHDRLLGDVLAADAAHEGLTLMNTIAKEQARELLESADDYF